MSADTEAAAEQLAKISLATDDKQETKSYGRRDHLIELEKKIQAKWEEDKIFESNVDNSKPKYLVTFPYPYMNGFLHVGHTFSLSKAEFSARYHRLKGENVLFPFSFHCTGMPIQAAANKLKYELATFGLPPNFPKKEIPEDAKANSADNRAKGKKSKLVAKTGNVVYQYDILKMLVPEEEIPKFQDPLYWLQYFPPFSIAHLKGFGVNVDWRRSFITTDVNPYYDAFIRWQLNTLNQHGRITRGKRPNVYSITDGQICADHDRSAGEAVGPQEYTIIKLKVLKLTEKMKCLEGKNVYLAPATLRPETMYGQTNCFVLPDGDYGAFLINETDVFIISRRAAKNLAHQEYSRVWGKEECLLELKGTDLLGLPLKAPFAIFDVIYTLPLLTILMGKGTGVVTSVPSDAPDDFAALRDLKEKPLLREKYGITDEMVLPYDVVPIIDIPGFGDKAAETVCNQLKVVSQNDKEKLAKAKEMVYLKGFYEGVLLVGSQKGMKVSEAKSIVRQELLNSGDAIPYWETESLVVSRSGDECVVAHLDQWYLSYGSPDWKKQVEEHVMDPSRFNAYSSISHAQYLSTLSWLKEWAPCRQFGLGTKLPWDKQFVVESLSDSTIYMAYYTISHLLQGNVDGSKPSNYEIRPEQLTHQVFDYIFLKGATYPKDCGIPQEFLVRIRKEFEYWYPLDLRVSGKDLIPNHLTMCLYNHAEIWKNDPSKWPRSFFTNGHVLVDAEKMSKSKGNFLTLEYILKEYGADCSRFACADAGDSMDDANFSRETCNMAILRLTTEEEWIKKTIEEIKANKLRMNSNTFADQLFEHQINHQIQLTQENYEKMQFRDALHSGFFELQIARDSYRDICTRNEINMSKDLILRFIEVQALILSPICPHFCEEIWHLIGKSGYISLAKWPETSKADFTLLRSGVFLNKTLRSFREMVLKSSQPKKVKKGQTNEEVKKVTHAYVYLAIEFPQWKALILNFLSSKFNDKEKSFPSDLMKQLQIFIKEKEDLKKITKEVMQFASFCKNDADIRGSEALELRMPFDQKFILESNKKYLLSSLELVDIEFFNVPDANAPGPDVKKEAATPGKPSLYLYSK